MRAAYGKGYCDALTEDDHGSLLGREAPEAAVELVAKYSRVDLRLDAEGRVYVLEANPKPDLKQPDGIKTSIVCVGLKSEAVIPAEQFRNEAGELEVQNALRHHIPPTWRWLSCGVP